MMELETIDNIDFNLSINFENDTLTNITGSLITNGVIKDGVDVNLNANESFNMEFLFDLPSIPNFNDFGETDIKDYFTD